MGIELVVALAAIERQKRARSQHDGNAHADGHAIDRSQREGAVRINIRARAIVGEDIVRGDRHGFIRREIVVLGDGEIVHRCHGDSDLRGGRIVRGDERVVEPVARDDIKIAVTVQVHQRRLAAVACIKRADADRGGKNRGGGRAGVGDQLHVAIGVA